MGARQISGFLPTGTGGARVTDQDRIARAILNEMNIHGGVEDFVEKLLGFPEQYCTDLAHAAMCEIARIEVERKATA